MNQQIAPIILIILLFFIMMIKPYYTKRAFSSIYILNIEPPILSLIKTIHY